MKVSYVSLLCLFLTISIALQAQCKLSITMVGNGAIRAVIDDRNYICQDNSLTIEDLAPGYHSVKLFLVKKERWNNSTYGQQVYNANLLLKSQYYTDIVVNRFGKTLVDEQLLTRGDYYDNMDRGNGGYGGNGGKDWDNHDNRPGQGPGNNNNNGNNIPRSPQQMSDNSFAMAKETIRKESFDNTRMTVAQQIADNNYFTTAQVKELVKLFAFEDRKLDFAKYAYARTLDRNNYFTINEVFSFSRTKEDLADYIKNFR
jgi:hypothetical protein